MAGPAERTDPRSTRSTPEANREAEIWFALLHDAGRRLTPHDYRRDPTSRRGLPRIGSCHPNDSVAAPGTGSRALPLPLPARGDDTIPRWLSTRCKTRSRITKLTPGPCTTAPPGEGATSRPPVLGTRTRTGGKPKMAVTQEMRYQRLP